MDESYGAPQPLRYFRHVPGYGDVELVPGSAGVEIVEYPNGHREGMKAVEDRREQARIRDAILAAIPPDAYYDNLVSVLTESLAVFTKRIGDIAYP